MLQPDLQRHVGKFYGKYSGEVIDNQDKDNLGQLKVKVPAIFGEMLTVTARPCQPYGHFFIPPVGTMVWVEFEGGDTRYPLWVGAWYPTGKVPQEAAVSPPTNNVIQTASGHTIEISDKDGEEKITIKHKGNAFISIDKNGSVLLSNPKGSNLFLNADKEEATLMEQHGHLMTMNSDGVLVVNKDGSAVELKGDTARFLAKNVALQGSTVVLGQGAADPTINGTQFKSMWDAFAMHTHATAVGPSGPPVPPGLPLMPGVHLTSAVLVK